MAVRMGGQSRQAVHGGIPNDAMAIYFADATIASAFVVRWCAGHRAASLNGLFQIREDEPKKRVPLKGHKTP